MFKKAKCVILCAAALFSTTCLAETHLLQPNMTMQFNFNSNQPEIIKNPIWWTITANCTIESQGTSNELKAVMLKKSGKVDGIELTENNSIIVTVHDKDVLKITAEAYAWVEITNFGANIKATCTT